jgi:hypothetical protein
LAQVDVRRLTTEQRARHREKVAKHKKALALCKARKVPSLALSNPLAALMKFSSGALLPAHRLTLTMCGQWQRLVVGAQLDAATNDRGQLESAVQVARNVLTEAGVLRMRGHKRRRLQLAADSGFHSVTDLMFAARAKPWADILLAAPANPPTPDARKALFRREAFRLNFSRHTVTCPKGRLMDGPHFNRTQSRDRYYGVGCSDCPLKRKCTRAPRRVLSIHWEGERADADMRRRMRHRNAPARYLRRFATAEPVFSLLEDTMGFRRCSSRFPQTIRAEVLLKLFALNLSRLLTFLRPRLLLRQLRQLLLRLVTQPLF